MRCIQAHWPTHTCLDPGGPAIGQRVHLLGRHGICIRKITSNSVPAPPHGDRPSNSRRAVNITRASCLRSSSERAQGVVRSICSTKLRCTLSPGWKRDVRSVSSTMPAMSPPKICGEAIAICQDGPGGCRVLAKGQQQASRFRQDIDRIAMQCGSEQFPNFTTRGAARLTPCAAAAPGRIAMRRS